MKDDMMEYWLNRYKYKLKLIRAVTKDNSGKIYQVYCRICNRNGLDPAINSVWIHIANEKLLVGVKKPFIYEGILRLNKKQ